MQKILNAACELVKVCTYFLRYTIPYLFRSYILTPETLAPAAVTVGVLAGGITLTATGPNATIIRLLGLVGLSLTSVGVGLLIASVRVRALIDRAEMAEYVADIRTEYIDRAQANINELKHRISRLYAARKTRVDNTGPTRVFSNYRRVERALP